MNSQSSIKYHIIIFKACGMWPPEDGSFLYGIWTIIFSLIINIGFPVSQLICVLYVNSINAMVDHLVLTSTVTMAAIKGFNVLAKRKTFAKLLRLMKQMDTNITFAEREQTFVPIFRDAKRLFWVFLCNYMTAWIFVALQVIFSEPKKRIWSSTYLYPSEFFKHPSIYLGGIVFQGFANFYMVVLDAAVDSYGAILLNVLGGHIDVLGQRLRALGYEKEGARGTESRVAERRDQLIENCENYVLILRYSKLLESILSFALMTQFGVSGLVLCTCAYQLTVVSPVHDTSKFVFSVSYSVCMIIEVFIPSYYGSVLMMKSENLPYDAFKSNWFVETRNFKKNMMILVEKSLKPIKMYAGSIFILNLSTLLAIMKTAYSLLALLKNVQK